MLRFSSADPCFNSNFKNDSFDGNFDRDVAAPEKSPNRECSFVVNYELLAALFFEQSFDERQLANVSLSFPRLTAIRRALMCPSFHEHRTWSINKSNQIYSTTDVRSAFELNAPLIFQDGMDFLLCNSLFAAVVGVFL
ncbi:MAG: hypothetical protein ABGZ35_29065 [Planctomycetaceae bacterium]